MMKNLFLSLFLWLCSFPLIAQVTISNLPTMNMFFDPVCQAWRPTNSPANLNIGDLTNDLMIMNIEVNDFDCSLPVPTCVGPIIVEEPILYASPFKLTLNSCTNTLVYAPIDNSATGDIFLTAGSLSGTTSDGYVVVGTGIEGINGLAVSLGSYSSNTLPIPPTRGPVFLSTAGDINIQAAKLLAVAADTLNGAYAQIGSPSTGSQGSITMFSGQSYAIVSRKGIGSYSKIGHGSNFNIPAISNAPISIINEDGNLWLYAGEDLDNQSTIGHATKDTDILNCNISISIYDGGNDTDGHIELKGGQSNRAQIGHFGYINLDQRISGEIVVQAEGTINMQGGDQSEGYVAIGDYNPATNNVIQSNIQVESVKGTSLLGGTNNAKAQIGHTGHLIDSPNSSIIVGSKKDISIIGGVQSESFIGHQIEDLTGLTNGGNLTVQAKSVLLESNSGANGWTGIGHYDPTKLSPLIGDIFITTNDTLHLHAGGMSSIAQIGHQSGAIYGKIEILSNGAVELLSGSTANAKTNILTYDSIIIYAIDNINMIAQAGEILIESNNDKVDIATQNILTQNQILGSIPIIKIKSNPTKSLNLSAGEDIHLVQETTNAKKIMISTDHDFELGALWPVTAYHGNPFFLFGFNPLNGTASPVKQNDSYGMLLIEPTSTFYPVCEQFELFCSKYNTSDGFNSVLQIAPTSMLNLNGVTSSITIGDTTASISVIISERQAPTTVNIDGSTWSLDSTFIKSGANLIVNNSTITTSGKMTLISDNLAPVSPFTGFGVLTIIQSTLNSGNEGIRLYSNSSADNLLAGGFTGTTFNAVTPSSCIFPCSTETWPGYYPYNALPLSNSYLHVYKLPTIVLALQEVNMSVECHNNHIKLTANPTSIDKNHKFRIESSSNGINWKIIGQWQNILDALIINKTKISNSKYLKLVIQNNKGTIEKEEIIKLDCETTLPIFIYPQPAFNKLYIENDTEFSYKLYDLFGRELIEGQGFLDVSHIPSGSYLLLREDGKIIEKVIIGN